MAFHGVKVNEPVSGAVALPTVSSRVLGLVATGPDADAGVFPLGAAVALSDPRAAIAKAGAGGTLAKALSAITAQCAPTIVVVRVAVGVAGGGKTAAEVMDANVVAGIAQMLGAESALGPRPRVLGAPGLDTLPVANALATAAQALRGFVYARAIGATRADAIAYRQGLGQRELMLIWPDFSGWAGQAVATAMGLRARLDEEQGFAKSLSNVAIAGATGLSTPVSWDLQSPDTDAGALNAAQITTLIRKDGFRFWGSRTCDLPTSKFTFEVSTRTAQILRDTIADGLMPFVDRPLTIALVRDIVESINAKLRSLRTQSQIIGGRCWFDPSNNPRTELAAGHLVLDYDYTPCAPLEALEINQRIVDSYYADFKSLAA